MDTKLPNIIQSLGVEHKNDIKIWENCSGFQSMEGISQARYRWGPRWRL